MKCKDLAIPLRCVDFSDSSQVVALFGRARGLVEGIAKGAHRPKGSFQGPFDLAVLYEVLYLERHGGGLSVLTESTVLDGFRGVRLRWDRHVASSHVIELLRAVAVAGEAEGGLFDLAVETFGGIAAAEPGELAPLLARFDAASLRLLGLLAPMDACVECGRERPRDAAAVFLSPRAGGIVCRGCRSRAPAGGGMTLAGPALGLLERLAAPARDRAWEQALAGWEAHGRALRRALTDLRTGLLDRELVLLESSAHWI
ncbi:MAG: DNA repair protein RecO [Planctomycetes bacterium]|nr:DNA repair protein RecO [Planctomycetota bacterium]